MTVKGVRRLLVGAAVAMAFAAAAIVFFGRPDRATVVTSPGPSAVGSPSHAPTPTSGDSPSPAHTPGTSGHGTGPLGAANDAVIVRFVGNGERPDAIEVSMVPLDAAAFETQLQPRAIARLPGSAIPEGLILNAPAARYGHDGWLALDVADPATTDRSILVFDLRASSSPPWLVPGRLVTASWGPRSVLAVRDSGEVHLYDPNGNTGDSVPVPSGVMLGDITDDGDVPPTWLADGSGFLAWRGGSVRQLGKLDLGGAFTPTDLPPSVFQSTGRERRWSADGTELSSGCPTEGGPAGCSVISGVNGGEAQVWYSETSGGGVVQDYAWDAEGDGMWFVLERVTGEGPVTYALAHFDVPGEWIDVAVTSLQQPSEGGFEIQGLGDAAATLDGRHVLIGPQRADVQVAVSGDGSVASFEPGAWFAGWAGDLGPYPAR
jgi:hypothetical protein